MLVLEVLNKILTCNRTPILNSLLGNWLVSSSPDMHQSILLLTET